MLKSSTNAKKFEWENASRASPHSRFCRTVGVVNLRCNGSFSDVDGSRCKSSTRFSENEPPTKFALDVLDELVKPKNN